MFKCAFYEREITPPLGCHIAGYGNVRGGTDVKDRLMAKACVVSDGKTEVALIVLDACRVVRETRDAIAKRVREFTGIPEENVLVAATHTHTGTADVEVRGDAETAKNSEYYFEVFTKLIADCAILAYKRLTLSELSYGVGKVEGISFCRDYIMKNATPQTNPTRLDPNIERGASEIDTELPVLFIKDKEGEPMGAIISFACHLDCVGGSEYSGDFASEISRQMKKVYGADFVTVFFMGTAGDINHFDVNRAGDAPNHYKKMGQKIAGEAIRTISFAEPVEESKVICKFDTLSVKRREISSEAIERAKHVVATVKEEKGVKIAADGTNKDQYELMMSKRLLAFIENESEEKELPVHYIQIGDVAFFGLPSEVFCYFGLEIKRRCGKDKRFVATACNGAYGYIPTKNLIYDTIYESRPGANRVELETGYKLVEKLLEMSK